MTKLQRTNLSPQNGCEVPADPRVSQGCSVADVDVRYHPIARGDDKTSFVGFNCRTT